MAFKQRLQRAAIHVVGWAFILLGIAGLVLPILQGILFILVGLFILSSVSPWADRLLQKIRRRFPRISNQFDAAKEKAKKVQARIADRFSGAKTTARQVHRSIFRRKQREP